VRLVVSPSVPRRNARRGLSPSQPKSETTVTDDKTALRAVPANRLSVAFRRYFPQFAGYQIEDKSTNCHLRGNPRMGPKF
jgi:hypothetical protein